MIVRVLLEALVCGSLSCCEPVLTGMTRHNTRVVVVQQRAGGIIGSSRARCALWFDLCSQARNRPV